MNGTLRIKFDRAAIGFPDTEDPGDDFVEWRKRLAARLVSSGHPFAAYPISNGPLQNHIQVDEASVTLTVAVPPFRRDGTIAPTRHLPIRGIEANPTEYMLTAWVFVPPGEWYVRGIHAINEDGADAEALVTFDPTEKTGLPRYRIDVTSCSFVALTVLLREILTGRLPEITHAPRA